MFHFKFVHYTFSSVWVAEWPPFGKELPARLSLFHINRTTVWSCVFVVGDRT